MRSRIAAGLAAVTAGLVLTLGGAAPALAQKDKDKGKGKEVKAPDDRPSPKFLYGHDLRIRPGGETDWVKAVKVGVEVFHDETTNTIIGISEAGALAVIPGGAAGQDKKAEWKTAHDLSVRKAGEPEFTQQTKKYGVETFLDRGSNRLLYGCQSASIAFAPVPAGLVTDKGPKWHHALEPKVRAPDQERFENAKKFGMEVFKDENTGTPGTLIYITETGSIATAPAPASPPDSKKIAPPKTAYGLVLRVRGANEPDFTEKTKRIGVEVFTDPNANDVLFYITESGSVATAPNPGKFADARGVTWKHAVALKARKGGEKSFDNAKKYGVEVFEDNRTGHLIFISDTGAIAVLPKQQ
jgi:hypothetical protein